MLYRITHIRKPHRDSTVEHITHVKGIASEGKGFLLTVQQTIVLIESKDPKNTFYVLVGTDRIDVVVQTSAAGNKYIKTKPDRTLRDNLLSLPEIA